MSSVLLLTINIIEGTIETHFYKTTQRQHAYGAMNTWAHPKGLCRHHKALDGRSQAGGLNESEDSIQQYHLQTKQNFGNLGDNVAQFVSTPLM